MSFSQLKNINLDNLIAELNDLQQKKQNNAFLSEMIKAAIAMIKQFQFTTAVAYEKMLALQNGSYFEKLKAFQSRKAITAEIQKLNEAYVIFSHFMRVVKKEELPSELQFVLTTFERISDLPFLSNIMVSDEKDISTHISSPSIVTSTVNFLRSLEKLATKIDDKIKSHPKDAQGFYQLDQIKDPRDREIAEIANAFYAIKKNLINLELDPNDIIKKLPLKLLSKHANYLGLNQFVELQDSIFQLCLAVNSSYSLFENSELARNLNILLQIFSDNEYPIKKIALLAAEKQSLQSLSEMQAALHIKQQYEKDTQMSAPSLSELLILIRTLEQFHNIECIAYTQSIIALFNQKIGLTDLQQKMTNLNDTISMLEFKIAILDETKPDQAKKLQISKQDLVTAKKNWAALKTIHDDMITRISSEKFKTTPFARPIFYNGTKIVAGNKDDKLENSNPLQPKLPKLIQETMGRALERLKDIDKEISVQHATAKALNIADSKNSVSKSPVGRVESPSVMRSSVSPDIKASPRLSRQFSQFDFSKILKSEELDLWQNDSKSFYDRNEKDNLLISSIKLFKNISKRRDILEKTFAAMLVCEKLNTYSVLYDHRKAIKLHYAKLKEEMALMENNYEALKHYSSGAQLLVIFNNVLHNAKDTLKSLESFSSRDALESFSAFSSAVQFDPAKLQLFLQTIIATIPKDKEKEFENILNNQIYPLQNKLEILQAKENIEITDVVTVMQEIRALYNQLNHLKIDTSILTQIIPELISETLPTLSSITKGGGDAGDHKSSDLSEQIRSSLSVPQPLSAMSQDAKYNPKDGHLKEDALQNLKTSLKNPKNKNFSDVNLTILNNLQMQNEIHTLRKLFQILINKLPIDKKTKLQKYLDDASFETPGERKKFAEQMNKLSKEMTDSTQRNMSEAPSRFRTKEMNAADKKKNEEIPFGAGALIYFIAKELEKTNTNLAFSSSNNTSAIMRHFESAIGMESREEGQVVLTNTGRTASTAIASPKPLTTDPSVTQSNPNPTAGNEVNPATPKPIQPQTSSNNPSQTRTTFSR